MMIEATVLAFLKAKLDTSNVFTEIPTSMPEEFVTIQLIDRGIRNHIESTTFDIRSYAPTKYEASLLDAKVRNAMLEDPGLVAIPNISACEYGGGSDAPDTSLKHHRYRSYFNITIN